MWIVKIGGSLAQDPLLPRWLRLLAAPHGQPVVIVPGGGAFADAVRAQQAHWRFGDGAAHAMALLAMAQFGLMLQALCPALGTESSLSALGEGGHARGTRVWLPLELLGEAHGIEASWRVTSDGLAAWLARTLQAERLLLVKSCSVPRARSLDELSAAGVIDQALPGLARGAPFAVELLARDDLGRMRALLHAQEVASD